MRKKIRTVSGMAGNSFKLVSKMRDNVCCIFMVNRIGDCMEVARILFPNDNQINDNVETVNSIITILRKRIRKSV